MLKVKPHADYPTEEGRYLRGNDFSPITRWAIPGRIPNLPSATGSAGR